MRHTLNMTMTPEEGIEEMVEKDEVALVILTEIINKHIVPQAILLDLDDMNIRGEQIKIGVEVCDGDIKLFTKLVTDRSLWLCNEINKKCIQHRAVQSGASFRNRN